jgi:hypothetical protein
MAAEARWLRPRPTDPRSLSIRTSPEIFREIDRASPAVRDRIGVRAMLHRAPRLFGFLIYPIHDWHH